MKKIVSAFIYVFLLINQCHAQKHDVIWFVAYSSWGNYAPSPILNFYTGTLDTGAFYTNIRFARTNNSMCDANGNLKFYTNGSKLYNSNHQPMANSATFNHAGGILTLYNGDYAFNFQCAVSLPFPNYPDKYIIFHLEGDVVAGANVGPLKLYWSELDGSLNNGLGEMTLLNQIAIYDSLTYGSLAAVKHANGRDWWVTIKQKNSNLFQSILVTPYGVSGPSVQSITGPSVQYSYLSQSVFSENGEYYACAEYDSGRVHIYFFDRCTGQFDYREKIQLSPSFAMSTGIRGIAFSPNSKLFYISNSVQVFQLQLDSAIVSSTLQTVATFDGYYNMGSAYLDQMMLTPDSRIFIGVENEPLASIIEYPDSIGQSCFVNQHCIQFSGYQKYLPTQPNFTLGALQGSICDSITSINDLFASNVFGSLYVNYLPSNETLNINSINLKNGPLKLEIIDINGRIIYTYFTTITENKFYQSVNVSEYANGLYFVRLINHNEVLNRKILKH